MTVLAEPVDRISAAAAREARARMLPAPVAHARGRIATWVAAGGVAGFAAIFALVRARRSEAIDLALTIKLQRRAHPRLDPVMRAVSWPGFPPQSRVVPPAIIGGLWLARLPVEAAFLLLAWGSGGLSTILKALMKRPRPVAGTDLRVVAAPLGGSSFPSGHVITYMGTYGFLAYLVHTRLRRSAGRRPLLALLLALLALVGLSRIHQGHHWTTDVTASYLLGASYLIVLIGLHRRFARPGRGGRPVGSAPVRSPRDQGGASPHQPPRDDDR